MSTATDIETLHYCVLLRVLVVEECILAFRYIP